MIVVALSWLAEVGQDLLTLPGSFIQLMAGLVPVDTYALPVMCLGCGRS